MRDLPTNISRHYRVAMEQNFTFGKWTHQWRLIGRHGGVHLRISGPHVYDNAEHWSAGLEIHFRTPPEYMENDPPSHDQCWLLKCPCWHEGTSLYAQERFLPMFIRGDDKAILQALVAYADDKLGGKP